MIVEKEVRGLNTVVVDREKALKKIRENAKKHEVEYRESMAGYKVKLLEYFEQCRHVVLAKKDEMEALVLPQMPIEPRHHMEEYRKSIEMLEWNEGLSVALCVSEFEQLIMDKWHWSGSFEHTKFLYNSVSGVK